MSMKRVKQRTQGSPRDDEARDTYFAKPAQHVFTWEEVEAKPEEAFVPYAMTERFAKGAFINHSKFGRGVVIAVEATNVQILFKDGTKKLGHGAS
jgi:hypothetical protein